MSEREYAHSILEIVPDEKLGDVIAYMQGIMANDSQDDEFCEKLLKDYEDDPDKNRFISIEETADLSGVDIYEV